MWGSSVLSRDIGHPSSAPVRWHLVGPPTVKTVTERNGFVVFAIAVTENFRLRSILCPIAFLLIRHAMQLPSHTTDEATSPSLLLAVRDGRSDAWHRLVRIYGPLLVRWCRRCGLQESDAFDVSQEILIGVNQSLERFEHRSPQDGQSGSFRGWLWSITRNKIADHHRRRGGKEFASGGTAALQQFLAVPDDSPETTDDIADLHLRALEELKLSFNETTWTAFWRVVVEGDSAKDVAEDLGVSVWAIYKAKTRILSKLKEEFGEEFL